MPRIAHALTAAAVAKLKQPGRYFVGGVQGLQLRVTEVGTRLWVYRVVIHDKRHDIGLGNLDDVTLSQARDEAAEIRRVVRAGWDFDEVTRSRKAVQRARMPMGTPLHLPSPPLGHELVPLYRPNAPDTDEHRGAVTEFVLDDVGEVVQANLFRIAAEEYIEAQRSGWKNPKHAAQWGATLEAYAYPLLGGMDVAAITSEHVLKVLKPIWNEKTETASRVRGRIEAVLDYATVIKKWRKGDNPARWKGGLEMILPAPKKVSKVEHHEAMPIDDAPAFFRSLSASHGLGAMALQLLMLTAARSGEIRGARWSEFDLEKKIWTVPADRMKASVEHIVPLCTQALHLLSRIPKVEKNGKDFLFHSVKDDAETISDMTITKVLRDRKLTCVPHGFRSTFRDWAGEHTSHPKELAEMALAHTIENKSEAAYRRMRAVERRRPLMQDWGNFLEAFKDGQAAIAPEAKDQALISATQPHLAQS